MQDTSKHRLLGTKGSLTGEIPCNPSNQTHSIYKGDHHDVACISGCLQLFLGTFFGVFVINLVSMNKIEENDDEYQNH